MMQSASSSANRSTSAAVYNRIREEGLLSKRRWEVYEILYMHGPLTGNEIIKKARERHPDANQTGFNARLSELKRMDAVVEVGRKDDEVSGHSCYLWDVTGKVPKALPRIQRHTRRHLEKCREVLVRIWSDAELPDQLREYISSCFEKKRK